MDNIVTRINNLN